MFINEGDIMPAFTWTISEVHCLASPWSRIDACPQNGTQIDEQTPNPPLACASSQMSAADIKSEIRDLYITGAKQVRFGCQGGTSGCHSWRVVIFRPAARVEQACMTLRASGQDGVLAVRTCLVLCRSDLLLEGAHWQVSCRAELGNSTFTLLFGR